MKNLKDIIFEKLNINKINIPNQDKIMMNNIVSYLSDWLNDKHEYIDNTHHRHMNTGFLLLSRYFLNDIYDILNYYPGEFETMSEKLQINIKTLTDFILYHNDEIINKCKENEVF